MVTIQISRGNKKMSETNTIEAAPVVAVKKVTTGAKRGRKKGDTSFVLLTIDALTKMGVTQVEVSKRWLKSTQIAQLEAATEAAAPHGEDAAPVLVAE